MLLFLTTSMAAIRSDALKISITNFLSPKGHYFTTPGVIFEMLTSSKDELWYKLVPRVRCYTLSLIYFLKY